MKSKEKQRETSIRVLPEHLINQIAAGEVIENPSSVVKELVDNAIDAKASIIRIKVKLGGMLLIIVEDNGYGMEGMDILLALKRHATSKIYTLKDLHRVQTMGFRGEALASIAAIAKMKIESAKKGHSAKLVEVQGGKIINKALSSRTEGTTVEVQSLFFNTPVRRKFQKTQKANLAEIIRLLTKIALAHPHIGFTLESENNIVLQTDSYSSFSFEKSLTNTIRDLLGKKFLEEMIFVNFHEEKITLVGYIGLPNLAKKTRGGQYSIINGRSIFCPIISQAIQEGYGTRLSDGVFPFFVLHLQLPYEWMDINVHPQKKEIRLREELFIKEKIKQAISLSLLGNSHRVEEEKVSFHPCFSKEEKKEEGTFSKEKESILTMYQQKDLFHLSENKENFFPINILGISGKFLFIDPSTLSFIREEKEKFSIAILDIEAAYSRCLFEVFLSFQNKKKVVEKQYMNPPCLIDVNLEEKIIIEEHLSFFHHIGLEIRFVADRTIAIDTCPSFLKGEEIADIFSSLLEDILLVGKSEVVERKIQRRLAQSICRFIKGKKKIYSLEEAKVIIQKLFVCKSPDFDPLGEPIYLLLNEENIQKLFMKRGRL